MKSNLKGKSLHLTLKDVKESAKMDETRNRDLNALFRSKIIQTNKKNYNALPKIRQECERERRRI